MRELDRRGFEEIPKAQLHIHLDGALPVPAIWEISQQTGIELPGISEQTREKLEEFYRIELDKRFSTSADFDEFLKKFAPVLALMQTPRGLQETALAHVRDLASQHHVYAETRFAPQYHRQQGLSLEDIIENVLIGLRMGHEETGTLVKLIICIGRECDSETSAAVARAALQFQDEGVVAIDLACNEIDFPPELHLDAYRLTIGTRLRRTVHAGELAKTPEQRVQNIRTALNGMQADGLGHAVPLASQPDLIEQVYKGRIRVESCPLSNRITGAIDEDLKSLGLDVLLRDDILVSLSTDDPLMFKTPLARVFEETCRAYRFGIEEVRTLLRNAVVSAFCSDEERARVYFEFKRRDFPLY